MLTINEKGATNIRMDFGSSGKMISKVRYTTGKLVMIEELKEGCWKNGFLSGGDGQIVSWAEADCRYWDQSFNVIIDECPLNEGWVFEGEAELTPEESGARHHVITLLHRKGEIKIRVHTLLGGLSVLVRWLEIENLGKKSVSLTDLSVLSMRLGTGPLFSMGYYSRDAWANEGWWKWEEIPIGTTFIGSNEGLIFNTPCIGVRDESSGEYTMINLAWSANWQFKLDMDYKGLYVNAGPTSSQPLRVIAPDECIKTPRAHMCRVSGSFDSLVQTFHKHMRRQVIPSLPEDL